jgi:hypothetical protein
MKTLDNKNQKQAVEQINDIKIVGDTDEFELMCKASSKKEGWMKSTKAYEIPGVGCLVQVSTQQGDNVAESICFVPNVKILEGSNGGVVLREN